MKNYWQLVGNLSIRVGYNTEICTQNRIVENLND